MTDQVIWVFERSQRKSLLIWISGSIAIWPMQLNLVSQLFRKTSSSFYPWTGRLAVSKTQKRAGFLERKNKEETKFKKKHNISTAQLTVSSLYRTCWQKLRAPCHKNQRWWFSEQGKVSKVQINLNNFCSIAKDSCVMCYSSFGWGRTLCWRRTPIKSMFFFHLKLFFIDSVLIFVSRTWLASFDKLPPLTTSTAAWNFP